MIDPILTGAVPGGFHFTVANFSSDGTSDVVTVKLIYTANTSNFFTSPTFPAPRGSEVLPQVEGQFVGWTPSQLLTLRGVQSVQVQITILGDTGQSFADLSRTLIETLAAQDRMTNLTPTILFNWLVNVWMSYKTHFVAALARKTPYTLSLACPQDPPAPLVVTYPEILSANTPATIPALQIHLPPSLAYSDLPLGATDPGYLSQSTAVISYPTPGAIVLADAPIMLVANPGMQTASDHLFVWYVAGMPSQIGQQIPITFINNSQANINVPIVLMVTNNATGVSAAALTYVVVQP